MHFPHLRCKNRENIHINAHHSKHVTILHTRNVNPLKPIIMKLTYTRKTTFNIDGTTIHSTLAILINKNFNEFKALNDERCDILIKTYTQLQLLIIYEISLVGNIMLTFMGCKLHIIKQVHDDGWFKHHYVR